MSIKACEPNIQVCLVHDENSIKHLDSEELNLFDIKKIADPQDYTIKGQNQYQVMKLCVNKYTPFKNTLYIDVDTLWFPNKNITDLLKNLLPFDFFIGKNGEYNPITRKKTLGNYTYWGDPAKISRYFKLQYPLPQTISGVFWFKKSDFCDKLFKRALQIYNDSLAPTRKWANGKADEYCFNVALSEMNYRQTNTHFVYFDKSNGLISREQMYNNFWGIAAGGNKLSVTVKEFCNDLINMYHSNFNFKTKRLHVDKADVINERKKY
jgi:hypothetical protein